MMLDRITWLPKVGNVSAAESRLINIQREKMEELERKLDIKCTTRKAQKIEIPNKGKPISEDQVQRQKVAIERMLNVRKLDFILETNNQRVIESYTKLKNLNKWK